MKLKDLVKALKIPKENIFPLYIHDVTGDKQTNFKRICVQS